MAYADIQNKVSQIRMANQVLLAQSRKDRDEARKKKKDKINLRKQQDKIKAAEEKARKEDREYYKGLDPNAKVYNRDGQEVLDDGSIVVDEDMRTNGPIIDPNSLLQIGGKALDLLKFVPQMMIRGNRIAGVPNFPGGGYGSTSGAFVDLSGEAYFLIDGELIPQGGYDPAKHGDLIPHGGPDIPQAMNNTNNSMKIYG